MVSIVGVASAHDAVDDERIDLDAGDARTSICHSAHHVHTTARTNNRVYSVRAQNIGDRRHSLHQIALPTESVCVFLTGIPFHLCAGDIGAGSDIPITGIDVHDRGGGVRVNHDPLGFADLIDLDTGDCVPPCEQY